MTMQNPVYRFAIIGTGAAAHTHAQAIGAISNACLAGVYGDVPAQAKAFAEQYGCQCYPSAEALLQDKAVDIVTVCTPSGLHAHYAILAAMAKKHIVVEKPLAITAEQLDAVEQAVAENGVKATVIVQLRFCEAVQKLKTAIDSGVFGKIYNADCIMRYYRSEAYYTSSGWRGTWEMDGGGALMNQGIHGVDLIQYLMGGIHKVYAQCRTAARPIQTEDLAYMLVEYGNGAMGMIHGTTIADPGQPRRITICGEKGSVVLEEDTIAAWNIDGQTQEVGSTQSNAFRDPMAFSFANHQAQLEDLLRAIAEDRTPAVDTREGRKAVDIILAAYRSSQTGLAVSLD